VQGYTHLPKTEKKIKRKKEWTFALELLWCSEKCKMQRFRLQRFRLDYV
jgi:hypothetical protein